MKKLVVLFVSLAMLASLSLSAAAISDESLSSYSEETFEVLTYDCTSQTTTTRVLTAENSPSHQAYENWLQKGNRSSTFELTAPAWFPGSEDTNSRTILGGEDNRQPVNVYQFPYSAVMFLRLGQDTNGDGKADSWGSGTGFMAGNKAMVTAAHCFWSGTYGWVEECRTYKNQNSSSYGSNYYYPSSWVCPSNYTSSLDYQYDWCIATMFDNIGSSTGYFGYGTGGSMINKEYTISGYPGDHPGCQYTASGTVDSETYYSCSYDIDMLPGQSGSPVYDAGCLAWAINTYQASTFNQGNRITKWCYDLITEARNS